MTYDVESMALTADADTLAQDFFLQISVLYLAFRLRLVSLQNGGVILCSLQQHESYKFIWIRRTC